MENNLERITAVLGPTNTGKTHLAVETMLEHESGIIGFPLRLLAREIFDKCINKVGAEKVALITGEEKIIPKMPKYYICTVESMPQNEIVDFIAVDERQIHTDFERGFIKAEVFNYNHIIAHGSEKALSDLGLIRQEGKHYIVKEGDCIFFKFNV